VLPVADTSHVNAFHGIATVKNGVYVWNSGKEGSITHSVRADGAPDSGVADGAPTKALTPLLDTSLRVHGEQFEFSAPLEVRWQWIKIPVLVSSVLRVDIRTNSPNANIRLVLFESSNNTVSPYFSVAETRKLSHVRFRVVLLYLSACRLDLLTCSLARSHVVSGLV